MEFDKTSIRQLFLGDLKFAGRLTPAQRFLAGPELFDQACLASKAGIRMEHPEASEEEVSRILGEWIAHARRP